MAIKYAWINPVHGMELEKRFEEGRRGNENGILFLAEYYMLKDMKGKLTKRDRNTFIKIVQALHSYDSEGKQIKGLFDRGAEESLHLEPEQIRTISHDNLTAIAYMSKLMGLEYHKDIYKHGLKNFFRYDNAYPEKPRWKRIQHPRDIIFWSYLGGGKLARAIATLFMPLAILTMIITCAETYKFRGGSFWNRRKAALLNKFGDYEVEGVRRIKKTDGKIIAFLRCYCDKESKLMRLAGWICHQILKRRGAFGKEHYFSYIFDYYFKEPQHPIRLVAHEVESAKKRWY